MQAKSFSTIKRKGQSDRDLARDNSDQGQPLDMCGLKAQIQSEQAEAEHDEGNDGQ